MFFNYNVFLLKSILFKANWHIHVLLNTCNIFMRDSFTKEAKACHQKNSLFLGSLHVFSVCLCLKYTDSNMFPRTHQLQIKEKYLHRNKKPLILWNHMLIKRTVLFSAICSPKPHADTDKKKPSCFSSPLLKLIKTLPKKKTGIALNSAWELLQRFAERSNSQSNQLDNIRPLNKKKILLFVCFT